MRNSGVLQKIELIVFLNSEIDMNKSLNIKSALLDTKIQLNQPYTYIYRYELH